MAIVFVVGDRVRFQRSHDKAITLTGEIVGISPEEDVCLVKTEADGRIVEVPGLETVSFGDMTLVAKSDLPPAQAAAKAAAAKASLAAQSAAEQAAIASRAQSDYAAARKKAQSAAAAAQQAADDAEKAAKAAAEEAADRAAQERTAALAKVSRDQAAATAVGDDAVASAKRSAEAAAQAADVTPAVNTSPPAAAVPASQEANVAQQKEKEEAQHIAPPAEAGTE